MVSDFMTELRALLRKHDAWMDSEEPQTGWEGLIVVHFRNGSKPIEIGEYMDGTEPSDD